MIRARRVATGLAVAAGVLGIGAIDHWTGTPWATSILIAALVSVALGETYAMLAGASMPAHSRFGVCAAFCLLVLRAGAEPLGLSPREARELLIAGIGLAMVAPLGFGILRGPGPEGPQPRDIARAAATAFPLGYVALLGSFVLEMRLVDGVVAWGFDRGLALCLVLVAAVKLGDTAAYFVGRTLGRKALCWASPKKTWEGSFASALAAVAVSVLLADFVGVDTRIMAGFGLVADLAGQGGDLVESYLKRALGVKDSASTFGEMGGVLDVLDAVLLAAPAAYLWAELLIVRAGMP